MEAGNGVPIARLMGRMGSLGFRERTQAACVLVLPLGGAPFDNAQDVLEGAAGSTSPP